jgi:hypothetical protein
MKHKPIIYIASPYTKGDPCMNTHFQMQVFNKLLVDNIVTPYIPLWTHFQHTLYPQPYHMWIKYDNEIIRIMDGCIRLNADIVELGYFMEDSTGADAEKALFIKLGKPVFSSIEQCYAWTEARRG